MSTLPPAALTFRSGIPSNNAELYLADEYMSKVARAVIDSQRWLSRSLDRLLPERFTIDGNEDFVRTLVPKYLMKHQTIYDVGGGKNPCVNPDKKNHLEARIFGLDIDNEELTQAPPGSYDGIICADITRYDGCSDADLVICQGLLEHVDDTEAAFRAISSIVKSGGLALIFVPSRNAVFARLNIMLPQSLKETILYSIHPRTRRNQGFPAYYDRCTPLEFKELASSNGLSLVEQRLYYRNFYFSFFFPFHLIWRIWAMLFYFFDKEQSAETFSLVLRKETAV